MNPCPCGFLGDPKKACKCAPFAIEKYMARISGPLLDRIDLHIEVPPVPFEDLSRPGDGTGSSIMREQVYAARAVQAKRFGDKVGGLNGRMTSKQIRTYCVLDPDGQAALKEAMEGLGLSARAHDRILRVARTIADLATSDRIAHDHVAEAIGFRALDRKLWET
jgi:magnesium chelatase family protein